MALHPMITVKEGKMGAEKYRGKMNKVITSYAHHPENDKKREQIEALCLAMGIETI